MSFDNARTFNLKATAGPDITGIEIAVARFDSPHPYLLFHSTGLPEIRRQAAANPRLRARTAKLLAEISSTEARADPRALIKRRARRLINTAFLAVTAEPPVAEVALAATRDALAQFAAAPTWKERAVIRSFLDCAEIAVAVSLAYDWLFELLTPSERSDIESAIYRNVLVPALEAYRDHALVWPRCRDNCTLVSNSGILIAALCVLPCYRTQASELLHHSLCSTWNVFSALAPDGAWREGLSYWSLAMRYAGLMVAALENTLGDSFGLADCPGFPHTGDFALHAVGPSGDTFNFGDSELCYDVSSLTWFAHRFGRPIDAWLVRESEGWYLPFTAIWPNHGHASPMTLNLPTGKIFRSGDLACFRNTWSYANESRPVYLAIKGGNAATGSGGQAAQREEIFLHAQADAGTFIVDGARHRWVVDMGPDDYDLPGYFDHGGDGGAGQRWQYYRSRAAGHNTLTIGARDQIPDSPASIIGSCVEGDNKWVMFDLSRAYGQLPGTIRRGAALLGRQIVIQDEIDVELGSEITWTLHTAAEPVALSGSLARFRIGDDRFDARILEPASARFLLSPPPPPRAFLRADAEQLHGPPIGNTRHVFELPRCADEAGQHAAGAPIRRLQISLPAGTPRVTVLLLPDCDGSELALPVTPLDHWLAKRPVRLTGVPRRGSWARGSRPLRRDAASRSGRSKPHSDRMNWGAVLIMPEPSDRSLISDGFTEFRRRGLLLSLTVSLSLGLVASTIYVPSVPAIAHGLHTSIGRVQLTFVGYLLAFATSTLILGPLSDRFGRKRMLICGLVLTALSSLGCAAAPTIEVLIAARVLQGIGACAGMVIGRAATRDIWRPEAAAQVIAGRVIVSTLMQAFAPVLGGYLQVWFGWRANFLVVMALACFAIALVICYLPDGHRGQRPSLKRQRMLASYRALVLTRRFIGYAFSGAGAHAGFHIFAAGAPAVLIGKFGLTPEQYGYYAALPPLGFIIGSFISQRLTGRLGIDRAITVGMMILVPAGLIMVALALAHISFPFSVVGPVIFVCCGSGLITSNAAVGSLGTNPLIVGAASGLGSFIQMTGAASATAALTLGPSGSQLVLALIIAFAGLFCVMSFGALMRSPPAPAEVKGALADAGVSSGAASPS